MRILHIASFAGNIGDIINHLGFYSSIKDLELEVNQLEMRKFYNNCQEYKFDKDLLKYINSFDGLILGGGTFFDVRWDNSLTGTTLDMSDSFIEQIKVPVLVNAMGFKPDPSKTIAHERFIRFINNINKRDNWMITLRNDGSFSRLSGLSSECTENISAVPDNGFLFKKENHSEESNYVGLSITNDLFSKDFNGNITQEEFNEKIGELCKKIINSGREIMFFLHTPQDIRVLYSVFEKTGGTLFRDRIRIAPYDVYTNQGAYSLNSLYCQCRYVIAMRFHANVTAIKNNVPIIGLAGHEVIKGLYDELGLSEQCVIGNESFFDELITKIDIIENNTNCIIKKEAETMQKIREEHKKYSESVKCFFNK